MIKETGCCPIFNPSKWDGKTVNWDNKKFIKDRVKTFMYIPLNFGGVMIRTGKKIDQAGAKMEDGMALSEHASKWNMDLYLAVDKKIPEAENVTLSGKFLAKVYEGNFKDTGIWTKDFEKYLQDKKLKMKKMYIWYTTCPKCAKIYGKNYVVLFAEI